MKNDDTLRPDDHDAVDAIEDDEGPSISVLQALTWIGESKRLIAATTFAVAIAAGLVAFALPPTYTARASLLAPASQQQSGSAAALAALGSLGALAGGGAKTPDDLYVALLKSDSVQRRLDERFNLRDRYGVSTYETLRKTMPGRIRVAADKKSGLIGIEVDDKDPTFAAELANAHAQEVTKVLSRLAVTEAQLRRVFFEKQLNDTKEHLVKAEQDMRGVQEKSGVIVLDKQAEALIASAAQVRTMIAEREVQLKVLRTAATEQNPDVIRLSSELAGLRSELARLGSSQGGSPGSAVDMPVGKLPEAGVEYVRARRELKIQETLLESMLRQFEAAKLDEAKEGQALQVVDAAVPPDRKSKPSVALVTLTSALLALFASTAYVFFRRYTAWSRALNPVDSAARAALARAWRWRG